MLHFDLFDFYRFMLAVIVCIYSTVRLTTFIWRWQGLGAQGWGVPARLYRYMVVLLLRARFRRFAVEFLEIGGLAVVLVLLLRLHWR